MKRSVKNYEKAIIEVLEAEIITRPNSDVKDLIISDTKTRHYQLLRSGWDTEPHQFFVHRVVIHFHIAENGKIWLLANNSEAMVVDELLKKGVPTTDIVLGFQSVQERPYSGFATA